MRHHDDVDILLWILAATAAILLLLFLLGRRAIRPGIDPTSITFDPALMARVQEHIEADRKIHAIKELREGTPGLGLQSAKLMVERMAARIPPPRQGGPTLDKDPHTSFTDDRASVSSLPLEAELEIRALKADGNIIHAVKLTRERTGWGLHEAKDYVDGL